MAQYMPAKYKNVEPPWWIKALLDIRIRVVMVLILSVVIAFGVPYLVLYHLNKDKSASLAAKQCLLEHELRVDCFPGVPDDQQSREECESSGCCWEEFGAPIPSCFHAYPTNYNYMVSEITKLENGYSIKLLPMYNQTVFGIPGANDVTVNIEYWTSDHLRILIQEKSAFDPSRYLAYNHSKERISEENANCDIAFSKEGQFDFKVFRKEKSHLKKTAIPLFNTIFGPLIVSDGLTEVTTLLPSFDLYGIGQGPKMHFRHDLKYAKKWPLFSRSNYNNETDETLAMAAGVHPFYLVMEKNHKAHGVLLVNSFPTEIVTSGAPSVTFRTTEERLDFHLFLGPTPKDVVRQLTDFVGRPSLPPYWALGYHSCRDEENLTKSKRFIRYTRETRIPHESDCGTVKISEDHLDTNLHKAVADLTKTLESSGRKLIVFHRPHITVKNRENSNDTSVTHYDDGLNFNGDSVFVKNPRNDNSFVGYLPNGSEVVYPDFFRTAPSGNVADWMHKHFGSLFNNLSFDGLILDMNTPVNFNVSDYIVRACSGSTIHLPFSPLPRNLGDGTICMDARHMNDLRHVNLHNIYGYKHMVQIRNLLQRLKQFNSIRPFLTSLSTFTGSGAHGGHWGGLFHASWDSLKQSVVHMLDFSIFGIPLYGASVCGSSGRLHQDLCSRWIQVAAFQPLLITHRNDGKELLYNHRLLTPVGRSMIQLRYSLIPYLYSLFYNATRYGDTVIRPLMLEFPQSRETYRIDEQFLWGAGLLVSPVLHSGTQKMKAYFPPGCWYDYYTGKMESGNSRTGAYRELMAIEYHVNLHIRGGHIIPSQSAGKSTVDSRARNFTLTVALNCLERENGRGRVIKDDSILAYGELFIDDGDSVNSIEKENFLLISFMMKGRQLTIHPKSSDESLDFLRRRSISTVLDVIHIYGIPERPLKFFVNGEEFDPSYNAILESSTLSRLNLNIRHNHTIYWEPTI